MFYDISPHHLLIALIWPRCERASSDPVACPLTIQHDIILKLNALSLTSNISKSPT
jgi:hypothetical protein